MENNNPLCSVCNSPGGYMGQLGDRHWFRCQGCGLDFSIIHTIEDFLSLDQDPDSDPDQFPKTIQYLDFHSAGDPAVGIRSVNDQIIFGSGLECHDLESLEEIREGLKLFLGDICSGFPVSVFFDFETDPHYRGEKRTSPG